MVEILLHDGHGMPGLQVHHHWEYIARIGSPLGYHTGAPPQLLSHSGFTPWEITLLEWFELGPVTQMEATRPRFEIVLP